MGYLPQEMVNFSFDTKQNWDNAGQLNKAANKSLCVVLKLSKKVCLDNGLMLQHVMTLT